MKRLIGIGSILIALTLGGSAAAEPLSKIAVLDIEQVFESYPQESRVIRRIDELREEYEDRMAEYQERLDEIEQALVEAEEAEDRMEITLLETRRRDLRKDRNTAHEIMRRRIEEAYQQINEGEGIVQDILRAIEYVAIDQGYSAVMEADDSRLWWYSKQIDITDLVINRLRAIAR